MTQLVISGILPGVGWLDIMNIEMKEPSTEEELEGTINKTISSILDKSLTNMTWLYELEGTYVNFQQFAAIKCKIKRE